MRILLTGARAPVTLDLARHFHRAGHHVDLADSIHMPVARPSRAVRRMFVVTPPVTDPARYVDDVLKIVRRRGIDLVIPTCEEIYYLAARSEAFAGAARLFAEPLPTLERLHDKWKFTRLVADLATTSPAAAQSPETHLLRSEQERADWLKRDDTAEWVFKPVYSRFAARTLIGPTPAELSNMRPTAVDPWVAQRRIRGQEYSTFGVAQAGRLRAHACYRSAYRAGLGSGIYFLAERHPGIRRFVEQLVERLQFTGQIGFDFLETPDGRLYVLECNPRATSGLHLLESEPVADAFLDADGPTIEPTSSRPAMLGSVMLMYPIPRAFLRGEWGNGGLGQICRDMWRARDVLFSWSDPLPAVLSPLSLVEVIVTACRTRKPLTAAATFDIEWNGEPL